MTDKLEDISKSGISVEIKDKEYELSVLTIGDLADFRQAIKGKRIKLIQENIENTEERIILISKILDSQINETAEMGTMSGVCFLLSKSLQKTQKDLTLKDVEEMIDLENIGEVSTILTRLGGKVANPTQRAEKRKK